MKKLGLYGLKSPEHQITVYQNGAGGQEQVGDALGYVPLHVRMALWRRGNRYQTAVIFLSQLLLQHDLLLS